MFSLNIVQVKAIVTHMELWVAVATHNSMWVKISILNFSANKTICLHLPNVNHPVIFCPRYNNSLLWLSYI